MRLPGLLIPLMGCQKSTPPAPPTAPLEPSPLLVKLDPGETVAGPDGRALAAGDTLSLPNRSPELLQFDLDGVTHLVSAPPGQPLELVSDPCRGWRLRAPAIDPWAELDPTLFTCIGEFNLCPEGFVRPKGPALADDPACERSRSRCVRPPTLVLADHSLPVVVRADVDQAPFMLTEQGDSAPAVTGGCHGTELSTPGADVEVWAGPGATIELHFDPGKLEARRL